MPISVNEAVEKEVREKVVRLAAPRGTSIRTVLVYDGKIDPKVEEDGYFDYLIPIEQLFDAAGDGD